VRNRIQEPRNQDACLETRTKKPRCQDPKKKGKRKPRIKERIQKIKNQGSLKFRDPLDFLDWNLFSLSFVFLYVFILWILASWFLGTLNY